LDHFFSEERGRNQTLQELGDFYDMSRERVRQLLERDLVSIRDKVCVLRNEKWSLQKK